MRDADVQPVARLGHGPAGDVEVAQLVGGHRDLLAEAVLLVGPVAEDAVEDLGRERDEVGMGDPRPVEAVARLPLLVVADLAPSPSRSPPGRGATG